VAINKRKASPGIRIGIIVVAVMLVLSFIPWGSLGVFSGGNNTQQSTQGQLDGLAAQYMPRVAAFDQSLASEPTSYTVLVSLGNTYFDWGLDVQRLPNAGGGADRPMWISAANFYDRALAVNATEPPVLTDAAIAHFYAGDVAESIALVEAVFAQTDEFAPAYFNAGIFYGAAGMNAQALAAFERYLELDPDGQAGDPQLAASRITELQAATGSGETTGTP
jgi:tetratricopeptide (TPR) repeat protein